MCNGWWVVSVIHCCPHPNVFWGLVIPCVTMYVLCLTRNVRRSTMIDTQSHFLTLALVKWCVWDCLGKRSGHQLPVWIRRVLVVSLSSPEVQFFEETGVTLLKLARLMLQARPLFQRKHRSPLVLEQCRLDTQQCTLHRHQPLLCRLLSRSPSSQTSTQQAFEDHREKENPRQDLAITCWCDSPARLCVDVTRLPARQILRLRVDVPFLNFVRDFKFVFLYL